jgi:serine/threonine protein kinase
MTLPGAAPARLGRYDLLARLATGGMGEIFLARLEGAAGFEKVFVIKRILPHLAGDMRFRGMLIAEAQLASMMAHANICHVYELGETDGQLYIVMEYLEGVTMLPLLRKLSKGHEQLELGFIAGVIQQATDALHYAHELNDRTGENLGIVHRDVTPSNIFLTDSGVVKLLDFGIAKVKNASAHTQTGTVKGKYAYMAPEQLRGAAVDRRADVFALGVVLYEMLALRRLFQRKTDYLTFRAVLEQPIKDVRSYRPDCPPALADVVVRALDREPANRFETARELGGAVVDAISALQRGFTQGQIGDLVRAHFAHNIHERSQQIASAVHGGPARKTIPLIAQPDEETLEIEGGAQEFAPVDSPSSVPAADERYQAVGTGDHGDATELDAAPQVDVLRAVQGPTSQPQPIVVINRRSLLWPLVALVMVAVAAAALYLVWQKPPSIIVNNASGNRIVQAGPKAVRLEAAHPEAPQAPPDRPVEPSPARAPGGEPADRAAPLGSGATIAADRPPRPPAQRKRAAPDPSSKVADPQADGAVQQDAAAQLDAAAVRKALDSTHDALLRCETLHGAMPPGTRVVLAVAADGAVGNVTVFPERLDGAPLGTCIATVFRAVAFPHSTDSRSLEVKLRRKATGDRAKPGASGPS